MQYYALNHDLTSLICHRRSLPYVIRQRRMNSTPDLKQESKPLDRNQKSKFYFNTWFSCI